MSALQPQNLESPDQINKKQEKKARIQHYQEEQKARSELLERTKNVMNEEQNQYFGKLMRDLGTINLKVSDSHLKKIQSKIFDSVSPGGIKFHQSDSANKHNNNDSQVIKQVSSAVREQEFLRLKLKGIDQQLENLQKQKTEKPYNSHSQPSLKVFHDEEIMLRQQQATDFVRNINQKEQEIRVVIRERNKDKRNRENQKLLIQEGIDKEQKLEKFREKHEKLAISIAGIKKKHDNRLQEMMQMEESYFKQLDSKLNQLKEDRLRLKDKVYNKTTMISGIRRKDNSKSPEHHEKLKINNQSENDITRNLQIEQPYHIRINQDYSLKLQRENKENKLELDRNKENKKKYDRIDYINHQHNYKKKQLQLRENYENRRLDKLKKLGLVLGKHKNQNRSTDSKSWLLSEQERVQKQEDMEQKIDEKNERKRKFKLFIEGLKNKTSVHVNKQIQLDSEIRTDKLDHPKKYIKSLKKKRPDTVVISDKQIFESKYEEELDPGKQRELQIKTGNLYLEGLPTLIEKARQQNNLRVLDNFSLNRYTTKSVDGGLERSRLFVPPDPNIHMETVKKKYNLEQRYLDKTTWQKILEDKDKLHLPEIPERVQKTPLSNKFSDSEVDVSSIIFNQQSQKLRKIVERKRREAEAQKKNQKIKNSLAHQQNTADKILDAADQLDYKAQRMEKVAQAQWTTRPLQAVEQVSLVDDMIIDSINAKLKVLELQKSPYTKSRQIK